MNIRKVIYYHLLYTILLLTYVISFKDKYHDTLNNIFSYLISFDKLNKFINEKLKSKDVIFENGELNILNLLQIIIFYCLGYKYPKNTILVLILSLVTESIFLYTNKPAKIVINPLCICISYYIGSYFRDRKKKYNNQYSQI